MPEKSVVLDKKDNIQATSLEAQIDDLIGTRDPFAFRRKLDPILSDPVAVLKIILKKIPGEKDIWKSESLTSVMGWTGELISKKEKLSDEEKTLLRRSFKSVVDTARNTPWLSHHMTSANILFRFHFNDEVINTTLQELGRDIYTAIAQRDKEGTVVEPYYLRGYPHDNDLLEKIILRLEKNGARDEETLREIAENSTELEGYLRMRIIYTARRLLAGRDK